MALSRRLRWRLRWALTDEPWRLRLGDLTILAPRGGAGALIYYLGFSEPGTARFVMDFLKPGMTFWDIGAHIGEYSLLASTRVGALGRVEAFEPRPDIFTFLSRNVAENGLENVALHRHAAADSVGFADLSLHPEPSMSAIAQNHSSRETPTVRVPTVSLDHFHLLQGRVPHLVKVDVEGAERMILRGAPFLLGLPPDRAPVWVMEYDPENCANFGYAAAEILQVFAETGHSTFWLSAEGKLCPTSSSPPRARTNNIVASKRSLAR